MNCTCQNLEEKIGYIYKHYEKPFIIAIDASLGDVNSIGCITISTGPLKPGAGVYKKPSIEICI